MQWRGAETLLSQAQTDVGSRERGAEPAPTRIHCSNRGLCRWADHCASVWETEDSLLNVAKINRRKVKKFEAAGIATMAAVAD